MARSQPRTGSDAIASHSVSGQALVDDGIVIDSTALSAIGGGSDDALDAQAGALWGDVAKAALAHGRLPR